MPYQIKNGIIYSGNAVTLTQAQYDALPTIQKNNGTVYYIYDSNDIVDAEDVGVNGGNVEDLAGSVATFETSPTTSSHAEGEYILYQANLYKVIAPIDSGETLTVGSNIESAKVGDELSELKSGLSNLIKYKDVNGTTNNNGNLTLAMVGLKVSECVIIGVITRDNSLSTSRVYTPYRGTSDGWGIRVTDDGFTAKTSSAESVRIYYFERSAVD